MPDSWWAYKREQGLTRVQVKYVELDHLQTSSMQMCTLCEHICSSVREREQKWSWRLHVDDVHNKHICWVCGMNVGTPSHPKATFTYLCELLANGLLEGAHVIVKRGGSRTQFSSHEAYWKGAEGPLSQRWEA